MAVVESGDRVQVTQNNREFIGVLMPSTTDFIVIKLASGYNVGFNPDTAQVTLVEKAVPISQEKAPQHIKPDLPRVSIVSTGGTIASKIDYRTGAVTSQFDADDIIDAIPELTEIANIDGTLLFNVLSENINPSLWSELARCVYDQIRLGADGVIVTHGTDTMAYSAAALAFMLTTPVPVVFVGSQRSADRPSSDNVINAVCAAITATSDLAGVNEVMHENESDDTCLVHRATRTKKMHTSRRDAFRSINAMPVARVHYAARSLEPLSDHALRRSCDLSISPQIDPRCALVKFYPGARPEIIEFLLSQGCRGLVIEGTGLGHVSKEWIPHLQKATKHVPVIMTSQCINGSVCDRVYDTGRDLLRAGVIEAYDMLSETALVKLMWALGQTSDLDEVQSLVTSDVAGEVSIDQSRTQLTFGGSL
ncbi:MAG: Glu-tRNA(Gln) amidotransferase subunit GatD [Euryarchaeota archaeon]|nr:Glu-tRNA(Gln) amidotransferase subunit GatD [Euryarchaeota archaeon]